MKMHIIVVSLLSALGLSACGGSNGSTLGTSTTTGTGTAGSSTTQITRIVNPTGNGGTSSGTAGVTNGSGSVISNGGTNTGTSTNGTGTGSATGIVNGVANAEGLWQGSSDTSRTFTTLILDNGFYWTLYSPAGNSSNVAGVMVGNTLSSNGNITSSNGKDFNFETGGLFPFTWVGNYTAKTRLQGSLTYTDSPGSVVALNATHDSNYNLSANLAKISGTYNGTSTSLGNGTQDAMFVISATGQLSGRRTDGCTFTGSVSPRVRGNAYNVSINYGATCSERSAGRTASSNGSAYLNPANNQLFSVTLNNSLTDVLMFIGDKE